MVQMTSKQYRTTKRISHSNKRNELVQDIKTGKQIIVNGSYDTFSQFCSVFDNLETETYDLDDSHNDNTK